MERIRILLADDHPFFRDGVRLLLDSTEDTAVVGEANTGEEAIALAATTAPDVILMDIQYAWTERHRGDEPNPGGEPAHQYPYGNDVR